MRPGISLPAAFCQLLSLTFSVNSGENVLQDIQSASLAEIRRYGLTPWVFSWIKLHRQEDRLPPDLLQELRQDFTQQLLRSTMQQNEIREVLSALADAGLEIILLKGADLAWRVYGDPAFRPMSDLDLLLAPEDIPAARVLLTKLGYRPYSLHRDKRLLINEVLYTPSEGRILWVDLHWELVAACSFYYLPYRPLRAAALSHDFYGLPSLTLSPEHLLIHLCLHAFENFPALPQILDLALVVSRLSLRWPKVVQEAGGFGCQLPVCLVLQEIARLVPGKIPAAALAQLGSPQPSFLEMMVLRPRLRYLTLALPFFYRHRSLRQWFQFIGANFWPHYEALETQGNRWARPQYLKDLLDKFLAKFRPQNSPDG